jgi:hypothetical protein
MQRRQTHRPSRTPPVGWNECPVITRERCRSLGLGLGGGSAAAAVATAAASAPRICARPSRSARRIGSGMRFLQQKLHSQTALASET